MDEIFQRIGRLVYEADQHGLWTNTGIQLQLGWSPWARYGMFATDEHGHPTGITGHPLSDKALEVKRLIKSLGYTPVEKHKCCGKPYSPYVHTTCEHYAEILSTRITSHQKESG